MTATRVQRSVQATAIGLVTNVILACVKFIAGILGNSYALIADAIESFADIASSIIVWRGVVIAAKPADADHPYGHGRAETLAGAVVAIMLCVAALIIMIQSVREISAPHHAPKLFTLYVLLGVVFIKETLFRFVGRVGEELESVAVKADAWHHRSDAITSAAAALGISIALFGGEKYHSADGVAAIFTALIIGWNGYRLLKPAVGELMEEVPNDALILEAREIAAAVPGVKGVEKCLARKMGYNFVLDMHVEVEATMTVADSHELGHLVKDAIRSQLPRVTEMTVHIEPHVETL